jgi:hypothetical protein
VADMFDMGGILNAYTAGRQARTQQMLLQRQIAREDKQQERDDAIRSVYARIQRPQSKGGDPTAAAPSITAPYSAPAVETPRTGVEGRPIDQGYPQGSPLSPEPFKQPVVAEQPAQRQPHPSFTAEPHPSWLASNESLINEMMTLDPKEAFGLREQLSKLDDHALEKTAQRNAAIAKAAMHLSSFGSPQAQQAELQRISPFLIEQGVKPEEIQNFELTPQNLQWVQMEGMDLDKIIAREREDRNFAETSRHNRVTEGNAAAGIEVRRGALGLAQKREGRIGSGGGGGSSNDDLNYLIGGN